MNQGTVRVIKDLTVIVEFPDLVPDVHEIVTVDALGTQLLVDSLAAGGRAICLIIRTDFRIQKGMTVTPSGPAVSRSARQRTPSGQRTIAP